MSSLKQVIIGIVIVFISGIVSVAASDHVSTKSNTEFRIKAEKNQIKIMRDLSEIKSTLNFLIKEYDRNR